MVTLPGDDDSKGFVLVGGIVAAGVPFTDGSTSVAVSGKPVSDGSGVVVSGELVVSDGSGVVVSGEHVSGGSGVVEFKMASGEQVEF